MKSGKFGHEVNSDTRLQTVKIQMRRLLMVFLRMALLRNFTIRGKHILNKMHTLQKIQIEAALVCLGTRFTRTVG